jgi:WD40 repeat protein
MWDIEELTQVWSSSMLDVSTTAQLDSNIPPSINYLVRPGRNFILANTWFSPRGYFDMTTGALLHQTILSAPKHGTRGFSELMHGLMAYATDDGSVQVWNYDIQAMISYLDGPTDSDAPHTNFNYMALLSFHNKDGYVFAAADGLTGQVCFWSLEIDKVLVNLSTNRWRGCMQIHAQGITAMAGSVADGHLATGSIDGSIMITNIDSNFITDSMVKFRLLSRSTRVVYLSYMSGNEMVSADSDSAVTIWNTMTGALVRVLSNLVSSAAQQPSFGVVPRAGGVALVAATSQGIVQMNLVTGKFVFKTLDLDFTSLIVVCTPGMHKQLL